MESGEREALGRALLEKMLPPRPTAPPRAGQASEAREVAVALATEYCYGAVWARPGLDPRSRSLVTLGVLIADGKFDYVAVHARAAHNNGLTFEEILEAVLQTLPYVGFPATMAAFREVERVIEEIQAESVDEGATPEQN